ncbi:MotE family protein [Pseudorhodobacter sp. W20_MBD10_FR17]|uniref:MotE family protein n=1 Tax=Pseudorhodobacter sp. W20_MBD10_FR17 TaxID=3240266 RepID=UPI003F99F3C9
MSMGSNPKTARRSGRGTLFILAMLLAFSGALRLGDGIGIAIARATTPENGAQAEHSMPALDCPLPPAALAEALSEREARVSAKETALEDRLAALALADQAIDIRMKALAAAEDQLSETLARADGASEEDLTRLTEVYQSMKPKEAAALFSAMAPEFAAGFLGRMRPEASAAILSGMTPDDAYAISVILAGRNANVPKN